MKETDSLETRLRSWRPRRPSATLERRLFGAPALGTHKLAWWLGSLVPATACLLLTLSIFNPGSPGHSRGHDPMIAMILSNQNYAAYASDNFRGGQNNLSGVTFEWTNHNVSPSSMAPF
jgi:hypothetical protein